MEGSRHPRIESLFWADGAVPVGRGSGLLDGGRPCYEA